MFKLLIQIEQTLYDGEYKLFSLQKQWKDLPRNKLYKTTLSSKSTKLKGVKITNSNIVCNSFYQYGETQQNQKVAKTPQSPTQIFLQNLHFEYNCQYGKYLI